MENALIGYSGFVGSTLLKQTTFDKLYRSTNIHEIAGQQFDTVVCAGAPAQKWKANQSPEHDRQTINTLISHLKTIDCDKFILISTVDVFNSPIAVDENSAVSTDGLHPYGLHRRQLEAFLLDHFKKPTIIRLPGLVGPGLRKNAIFDLLNDNDCSKIDSRAAFQFYPMVNLWSDLQTTLKAGLSLVHLTSEPLTIGEIAGQGFGIEFENTLPQTPTQYDMRSLHSRYFGGEQHYQYSKREVILSVRAYAQSEPLQLSTEQEAI